MRVTLPVVHINDLVATASGEKDALGMPRAQGWSPAIGLWVEGEETFLRVQFGRKQTVNGGLDSISEGMGWL